MAHQIGRMKLAKHGCKAVVQRVKQKGKVVALKCFDVWRVSKRVRGKVVMTCMHGHKVKGREAETYR